MDKYQLYLKVLERPFKKLTKIDFLQPDGSIAFTLDNQYKAGYNQAHKSTAFIQSGSLSVSMQNGQRRKATITLANIDNAFDYNVNNIWFGQQIRLSMGLVLPDGTDFYLPQMVGYINNPSSVFSENQKTVTFPLVDKWAYLDGTLAGTLTDGYKIEINAAENALFSAIGQILRFSKRTHNVTTDISDMIDNVAPVFTTQFIGKTYKRADSDSDLPENAQEIPMTAIPYTINENGGSTFAKVILSLDEIIAGLIGYDQTGALRIEPSQDDVMDNDKPILWHFEPSKKNLVQISETIKNSEVYNDVIIVGQGLTGAEVWARAQNYDSASDTNINKIGLKTFRDSKANYWNSQQCLALADWQLKRKTVLQKSITITCSQMFHLVENRLITVKRTDKNGSPIERHLINSFTIPLSETGTMTINATSVVDLPIATTSYAYENMFTKENAILGKQILGNKIQDNADWFITNFIPIEHKRTYTQQNGGISVLVYAEDKQTILGALSVSNGTVKMTYENGKYIVGNGQTANIDIYKFFLGY